MKMLTKIQLLINKKKKILFFFFWAKVRITTQEADSQKTLSTVLPLEGTVIYILETKDHTYIKMANWILGKDW